MELTRKDIKMTQGLAILTMVSLHLFCRLGTDVYGTPLLWLNSTTPAVYILDCLYSVCSYRSCCGNGSEGTRFLERIFWKHVLY